MEDNHIIIDYIIDLETTNNNLEKNNNIQKEKLWNYISIMLKIIQ